MSSQMMNNGSSNGSNSGFSVLYDKTYSSHDIIGTGEYSLSFTIDMIPNYERLTKNNIFCGIVTADGRGEKSISISRVEYLVPEVPQIRVYLSVTGSGRMTVYVNCKVIG